MIIKYACDYNGRRVEAEVEFGVSGQGIVRKADNDYIRTALEEALHTPIRYETGEYRNGALASILVVAQPGMPEHSKGMFNPSILLSKGIYSIDVQDEFT